MGFITDDFIKYALEEQNAGKPERDTSKIWARVIKKEKILKDTVYELPEKFEPTHLFMYVTDIAHILDIPTPIILKSHEYNFEHFNTVRFRASEFVEKVAFDFLVLENAVIEEKKKTKVEKTSNYY